MYRGVDAVIFASALPARGASLLPLPPPMGDAFASALPARGASDKITVVFADGSLCLGAACTGCIDMAFYKRYYRAFFASALPARGASAKADKLRHTIL